MKITYAKVRKILIAAGEYGTAFSIKVGAMREAGLLTVQIAEALHTTIIRVNAFLPYEKAIYKALERTADAEKSELYRKRIRVAQERFIIMINAGGYSRGTYASNQKQEEETSMPWIPNNKNDYS